VSGGAVLETPQVVTPPATRSFEELGVSAAVVDALAMREIDGAFAIQALVLRDAIAGRDVLGRSQTGSGKTLAFAIPIVERLHANGRAPNALILVPTRELASQVAEEFRTIADIKTLQVATVYGGVGIAAQAKRARRSDIVIATPGRLLDLLARKLIRLDRVMICVLDEADRMLDMGFLPDVKRILEELRPDRQTMLFSATLDGEVGRLAERFTNDAVLHEVADHRASVNEATHRFIAVPHEGKTAALVRELAADRGLTLIFVRTKRGADRLARNLKQQGFHVGALHGDMTQPQRERALGLFAAGRNDVLVATDVAARGLDLEHISHVINFDPPGDEKAYVHRVGRTARAGRAGEGITFVTPQQVNEVRIIARLLDLHAEFERAGLRAEKAPPAAPRQRHRPRRPQQPQQNRRRSRR
jgi:ATP-dependent RNA helicase RhlE